MRQARRYHSRRQVEEKWRETVDIIYKREASQHLPWRAFRKGKIVIAPSAANSWSLTGWTFAPHESLPTHMKWPVRLALTVAWSSFLKREKLLYYIHWLRSHRWQSYHRISLCDFSFLFLVWFFFIFLYKAREKRKYFNRILITRKKSLFEKCPLGKVFH